MNPYQNSIPLRKELAEEYNRKFFVGAYVECTVAIAKLKAHIDEAYRTGVSTEYLYARQAELDRLKALKEDYRKQAIKFGADSETLSKLGARL
jgi:hypothetical protein